MRSPTAPLNVLPVRGGNRAGSVRGLRAYALAQGLRNLIDRFVYVTSRSSSTASDRAGCVVALSPSREGGPPRLAWPPRNLVARMAGSQSIVRAEPDGTSPLRPRALCGRDLLTVRVSRAPAPSHAPRVGGEQAVARRLLATDTGDPFRRAALHCTGGLRAMPGLSI